MQDAVLVADLGPNPASLIELAWALYRQHALRLRAAFLLTNTRSRRWLDLEILSPDGGALHDLHAATEPGLLPAAHLHLRTVPAPASGDPLEDELAPGHAAAWNAARWALIQEATAEAGEDPLIYGLIAGRRRTQTAVLPAMFPLLARPQDRCLDVRVSDPRAEGGSGFFFPEQPRHRLALPRGGILDARTVEVFLVEVPLPRLRSLLPPEARTDWSAALHATQQAIDSAAPPRLRLDLVAGKAWVNDTHDLSLSPAQLVWYATLAHARQHGDGWLWVNDHAALLAVFQRIGERAPWYDALQRTKSFQMLRPGEKSGEVLQRNMNTLRAKTARTISEAVASIPQGSRLIPEKKAAWDGPKETGSKLNYQRINLPAAHIEIRWPETVTLPKPN